MRSVTVTEPDGSYVFGIQDDNSLIIFDYTPDGHEAPTRVRTSALTALTDLLMGGVPLDEVIPPAVFEGPTE